MTFAGGLGITLLRAAAIAAVAVAVAQPVAGLLRRSRPGWGRRLLAALLLAPLLTPPLLVGYVYANDALPLVHFPLLNELLYASLLCLKLTPVAVGVLYFAPPPALSPQALHLRRLAPPTSAMARRSWRSALSMALHGWARPALLAAAAVFLLAFADFEMASLFHTVSGRTASAFSWTIALHEAIANRLPAGQILPRVLAVVLCEAVVVAAGLTLLLRTRQRSAVHQQRAAPRRHRWVGQTIAWAWLALTFVAVCVVPVAYVVAGAIRSPAQLAPRSELWASMFFAGTATVGALLVLELLWSVGVRRRDGVRVRPALALLVCVPGLLGGLMLALALVWLFQLPALRGLYNTPAPLVLALVLLALPVAVLLRLLFETSDLGARLHLTDLLRASPRKSVRRAGARLHWSLRGRVLFWIAALVFLWAYFEVVASTILRPTSLTPAMVQLYNLMHYQPTPGLSAMTAVTVAAPVALAAAALALRRLAGLRIAHGSAVVAT